VLWLNFKISRNEILFNQRTDLSTKYLYRNIEIKRSFSHYKYSPSIIPKLIDKEEKGKILTTISNTSIKTQLNKYVFFNNGLFGRFNHIISQKN
jgi:FMN phosphatase YigB (HAD superfamily)